MFAAGHSLAPVAMMLVAGTQERREQQESGRTVDGWLNKMSWEMMMISARLYYYRVLFTSPQLYTKVE